MKFTTSAALLASALSTVTRALPTRALNPILDGVLVETADHNVRLTCSDGNTSISARVDATIVEDGSAVAPGRLFTDMVRRSGAGMMSVSVNHANQFRLSCDGSRMNLAGQDADAFPKPSIAACQRKAVLTHTMLRAMLEKVLPTVASADLREVLTGCLFEARGGNVTMVGLDGFRLSKDTHMCSAIPDDVAAIIPGKAAAELLRLLRHDEEVCTLEFSDNGLHAVLGDVEIYTRLIAGQYVDYAKIIPTNFGTRVTASSPALRAAIDRAAIVAKDSGNPIIRLRLDGDVMFVESESEVANSSEEVPTVKTGDDLKIAFNSRYLIDAMKAIDSLEVSLSFNSSVTPCIIAPPEQPNFLILILPVRTH